MLLVAGDVVAALARNAPVRQACRMPSYARFCCNMPPLLQRERLMDRHLYLYAYDIVDDRCRALLLDMAQRFATGGQKSAYECWLSPGEAAAIRSFTVGQIDSTNDSVLVFRLDPRAATRQMGRALPPSDPDVFIFG